MSDNSHELIISPTARRQLAERLPISVAFAAYEFIMGPLLQNPQRVGKRLGPRSRTGTARAEAPTESSTGSTLSATSSPSWPSHTEPTPTAATEYLLATDVRFRRELSARHWLSMRADVGL